MIMNDITRLRLANQRLSGAKFDQPEAAVRWLGAVQAHGCARKAALLGDGQKGFKLVKIHSIPPECRDC